MKVDQRFELNQNGGRGRRLDELRESEISFETSVQEEEEMEGRARFKGLQRSIGAQYFTVSSMMSGGQN